MLNPAGDLCAILVGHAVSCIVEAGRLLEVELYEFCLVSDIVVDLEVAWCSVGCDDARIHYDSECLVRRGRVWIVDELNMQVQLVGAYPLGIVCI